MEKSENFVVVIDRDRFRLMNLIIQVMHKDIGAVNFMNGAKLHDTLHSFADDVLDRGHERGWCDDAHCQWVDPKKQPKDA